MENAYVYIKINAFNIIFPDKWEAAGEFPTTDWFRQIRVEGKNWQKILYVMLVALPVFCVTMCIDFVVWLAKRVVEMVGYIGRTVLDSFGKRALGLLAVAAVGFLIFWLWRTEKWRGVFEWLSSLFS